MLRCASKIFEAMADHFESEFAEHAISGTEDEIRLNPVSTYNDMDAMIRRLCYQAVPDRRSER